MRKGWLIVVILVIAIALIGIMGCELQAPSETATPVTAPPSGETKTITTSPVIQNSSQQTGIWVNGYGKVSATPDLANLSLGIEAQATTVSEARNQAAEAMDKVLATLKDSGIDEKDIRTSRFSIYPVRKWDRQTEEEKLVGFRVSNMVDAKIRELEKVGQIIDSVAEAGGDLTRIQGISFTVEDPTSYYNEARGKAFADAKAKAQQLASLAGITLGKVTYITESSGYYSPRMEMPVMVEKALGAPAPITPISPGEQEISVSVQVGYAIE